MKTGQAEGDEKAVTGDESKGIAAPSFVTDHFLSRECFGLLHKIVAAPFTVGANYFAPRG